MFINMAKILNYLMNLKEMKLEVFMNDVHFTIMNPDSDELAGFMR